MKSAIAPLAALTVAGCIVGTDPIRGTPPQGLRLQEVASGLAGPVYVTAPAGDPRQFIVELPGRIRIVENGQLLPTPFLDIIPRVLSGNERGMLSMAFHPQYGSNGHFYVFFTGLSGEIRIERFTVSSNPNLADPASAKVILIEPHPRGNHNGGLAMFGPDGMLYLGLGDGGGDADPDDNGQDESTLLGKLLRIDVNSGDPYAIPADNPLVGNPGARGEIWAKGLRNPWRFAFDWTGGSLYVTDVGESRIEEINIVPSNRGGVNYGWSIMEGSECFQASSCNTTGLELPMVEYPHQGGACSVTGGFVYRGAAIAGLQGTYFYADYCAGWIRSFRLVGGNLTEDTEWDLPNPGRILSFGEDSAGELYIMSDAGRVYKLVSD